MEKNQIDYNEMTVSGQKNSRMTSIITAAVLIGIGAALRAFVPPVGGITPNFVIAMYCLAIMLVRPNIGGAMAIGLVSGIISMMTSKSPIPYLNLLTEPTGALICFMIVKALPETGLFRYFLKPVLATGLGTIASGGLYVILNSMILGWSIPQAVTVFVSAVLTTTAANTVISYVIYLPAQKALGLNTTVEEA